VKKHEREALYREEALVHQTYGLANELPCKELEVLAQTLVDSKWWHYNGCALEGLTVRPSLTLDSEAWFDGWAGRIRLGPGECTMGMLLHELAHLAQGECERIAEHSVGWLAFYKGLLEQIGDQMAAAMIEGSLKPFMEPAE
jgi:hypothetical protein